MFSCGRYYKFSLILQNHFCVSHDFLKKDNVIIKVTADNTFDGNSYVKEKLITGLGTLPCYIYYHAGAATFSVGVPGPPLAFPPHPSPAGV